MARDTVVTWNGKERPTQDELQFVLEDYLAGLVTSVTWDQDRFFVSLPGAPSHPLRRLDWLPDYLKGVVATEDDGSPRPRWIEVWPSDDCVYVMTRMMDEVTNVLAEGFAQLIARVWNGTVGR